MPDDYQKSLNYVNSIIQAVNISDHSIFVMPEIHPCSVNILKILDDLLETRKATAFVGAIYNNHYFNRIKTVYSEQWESVVTGVANIPQVAALLSQQNTNVVKHKLFDVLLGIGGPTKPHRHFLYDMINNTSMKDKVIMNFRSVPENPKDDEFLLDEEGYEEMPLTDDWSRYHSSRPIKLFGVETTVAYMLPFNIYKQTAYSVVAETGHSNDYCLLSEKTFKPILAKRLFIMFAGQHYLKNLRSLGYQTFDGIIDETYDAIADPYVRWSLAFNQMMWLSTQYQSVILERARPILEHNAAHIRRVSWNMVADYSSKNIIEKMVVLQPK
jgi:hypothetical protein